MESIPLVRVSAILSWINFLNLIGAPTESYLKQAHLPLHALNDPEALIPLTQTFAFAELAARSEGIENLGILVGQQTPLSQLGGFGKLICQSLTLYDLLCTMLNLHSTLISGEQIWLTEDGQHLWLHHQYLVHHAIQTRQAQSYSVFMYLNAILLVAGLNWQPDQLHLQNNPNKAFSNLDCLSNTTIHFNQSDNAIRFSKSLLSKPLVHPTASAHTYTTEADLYATAPSESFIHSLRQLILLLLPEGYPGLSLVAEAAGTSVRTFQRRLEANHLNYSHLVEQVRFEQAAHLLEDPTYPLIDIAFDLGYTDAANFSRAFKRWTGVSPRQFRNLHLTAKAS